MKKKILALVLAASMILGTTGCQNIAKLFTYESISTVEEAKDSIANEFHNGDTAGGDNDIAALVGSESKDVRYQDDYYEYVNQNLLSKIQLQATDAHWDWFSELSAEVSSEMEDIIRDLVKDEKTYEKGTPEQKIKDL